MRAKNTLTTIAAVTLLLLVTGCEKKDNRCNEGGKLTVNIENETGQKLENFQIGGREFPELQPGESTCYKAYDSFLFKNSAPAEACSATIDGRKVDSYGMYFIECFVAYDYKSRGKFDLEVSLVQNGGEEWLELSNK